MKIVDDDDSVSACVEEKLSEEGKIDVLINNAGYVLAGAVEEASIEETKAQFETNFLGPLRLIKAVLPMMRSRRAGQIINVASAAGLVPAPAFWGIYSASKYALEGYSEHLWREVKPFNIHVSMVECGPVQTNLTNNQHVARSLISDYAPWRERALNAAGKQEQKGLLPEKVAGEIAKIVQSKSPRMRYKLDGIAKWVPRLHGVMPEAVFEKIIRGLFDIDIKPDLQKTATS